MTPHIPDPETPKALTPRKKAVGSGQKIVLLGHGRLGHALLEGLLDASERCEVVGVFPWSGSEKGKGYEDDWEKKLAALAREQAISVLGGKGANDPAFLKFLNDAQPDVLLIGSWGEILTPAIFGRENLKVVNCHPSLLPAHRGANPYASAIRAGETVSGVSFHQVNGEIDAGPVLLQAPVEIFPEDTGGSLRDRCAETARMMVFELLEITRKKRLKPVDTLERPASYFPPLRLEDGFISWKAPPEDIVNQVRGLQPWLDCYVFIPAFGPGKWMLAMSEVRLETLPGFSKKKIPPGVVVVNQGGVPWVSTVEPGVFIGLTRFRLWFLFGFLPVGVSRLLGRVLLTPGRQLLGGRS